MNQELKRCPFCDGEAVLIFDFHKKVNITHNETWQTSKIWWVKCYDCQFSTYRDNTRKEAEDKWNNRS